MRRLIVYILLLISICFIIPLVCTVQFSSKQASVDEASNDILPNDISTISDYDYKEYNKVKLLHTKSNSVEEVELDTYLYGVVSSEMPADFELEALKAQAVVARTYTIYKITNNNKKHGDADICDDSTCCQAWISKEDRFSRWEESKRQNNWDKIVNAVDSTQGKIITYDNKPINAFFHSNSGGTTEIPINVWGGSGYPYLQAVQTAGEEGYSQYSSEVTLSKEELIQKVKEKHNEVEIDWNLEDCIKIEEYTESGRVKTIKIGNINISGVEARALFGLKSSNFEVTKNQDEIKFAVKGYGHGVGMSQTGADSMAKSGSNYEEIIKHFYTGVEIKNM